MAVVRVIRPGLLTTVQDRGRWGYQSQGVSVAGPMDLQSHRIANALVGNSADVATLEVTLLGPELEFGDERLVAVAGAQFELTIDGQPVPTHAPFTARSSSRLQFGPRARGARAYLAIAGGIDVPPVLGSRATHLVTRTGGFEGRALAAGDCLPLGEERGARRTAAFVAAFEAGVIGQPATVRILPGPHLASFLPEALDALQSGPYRVGNDSDRMGFRLDGPVLKHAGGADIISEATLLGALQVPASGQPILLMADRQTSGGYPALATVISADLRVVGQLAPGDTVAFNVCSAGEAMAALIIEERRVMAVEGALRS
jgi:antagonist of KipI